MVRFLLVLAVVGCSGKTARVPQQPTTEQHLVAIVVKGNKTIETSDLVPGTALDRARRDGRPVDPYQLSVDTKRIRGAYFRMGFFEAKVTAKVDATPAGAQTVVFTIVEGPRAKTLVVVTGSPPELRAETVLDKLALKTDAPFDYELYDDGKLVVKRLVEDLGYPFVDVEQLSLVTVDRQRGIAVASYTIESGPRATIGKITITGVPEGGDLEDAIWGRLMFTEGDVYSSKAILDSIQSLYELGRFSDVRIDFDHDKFEPVVPITIAVHQAGRTELRFGGGGAYEPLTYEVRVRAGASYVPLDYPLQTYSADARVAYTVDHDFENPQPKIRILTQIQRLELWRPRLVGDVAASFDYFTVEAYTATGGQLRLSLSTPLNPKWLSVSAAWNLSLLGFSGISDAIDARRKFELHMKDAEVLGRYEQTISAELRDNPIEPKKGAYLALKVTEGTVLALGELDYLELQPDLRFYYPLGSVVVAVHARGGAILGDVPMTQRFFAGGGQSHRGFSARDLSPVEFASVAVDAADPTKGTRLAGVPVGGAAFLETGTELRVPLGKLVGFDIGTTLFVDAGDVTLEPEDLDPFHLHVAAGIGIFAKYGGFKIRFDVGERLNRRTEHGVLKNMLPFLGVGETY